MRNIFRWLPFLCLMASGAEIALDPLYENCGVSVIGEPDTRSITMRFREKGSASWKEALPLVKLPVQIRAPTHGNFFGKDLKALPVRENEWRGSIVLLRENTPYELEAVLSPGGKILKTEFTTRNSKVRVVKTVYLDEMPKDRPLILEAKGTPDGWIRYTMKDPKAFISGMKGFSRVILVRNSEYLLLEGLTVRGGARNSIVLRDSRHIQIVNCDIAGHAPVLKQALDDDGKYLAADGGKMWSCAAVFIQDSSDILVERCYIHSPAGTANPWFFSHSSGPMAIATRSTAGGLVFRYNDLTGSDDHRWDDAIGGGENDSPNGGFNRDGDIYGNMFALGNDDGIELDGGQSNIRCYRNRFEGMLCGISVAPCIVGPSYVFQNLIVNLGDFTNRGGLALKTVFGDIGVGRIHYFNNTGSGIGFGTRQPTIELNPRLVTRNNNLAGNWQIHKLTIPVDMDYDLFHHEIAEREESTVKALADEKQELHSVRGKPVYESDTDRSYRLKNGSPGSGTGTRIPNFQEKAGGDLGAFPEADSPDLPYRPVPVFLNRSQIHFEFPGKTTPQKLILRAEKNFHSEFKVRKDERGDWFSVTPSEGGVRNGKEIVFIVTLHPEKMRRAKRYKDAFLVRMADGFSRPVMVYADMRESKELRAKEKGVLLEIQADAMRNAGIYEKGDLPGALQLNPAKEGEPLIWEFEIPEDGIYYFFGAFHTSGLMRNLFEFSVDGDKSAPLEIQMLAGNYRNHAWRHLFRIDKPRGKYYEIFRLKKGKHTLTIGPKREGVVLEKIAVTNDIEMIYR
ncbi:MAG: hypothetical protein BWY31_02960 [Lentisphaerae bacterium ADurb.Bin242]|nr:MAG: hypothetical protein BWY31_02960 [Lentisphaerae bacterium ADurb.Bin242]